MSNGRNIRTDFRQYQQSRDVHSCRAEWQPGCWRGISRLSATAAQRVSQVVQVLAGERQGGASSLSSLPAVWQAAGPGAVSVGSLHTALPGAGLQISRTTKTSWFSLLIVLAIVVLRLRRGFAEVTPRNVFLNSSF